MLANDCFIMLFALCLYTSAKRFQPPLILAVCLIQNEKGANMIVYIKNFRRAIVSNENTLGRLTSYATCSVERASG